MDFLEYTNKLFEAAASGDSETLYKLQLENAKNEAKYYSTRKRIAMNALRAKFMAEHWDDAQLVEYNDEEKTLCEAISTEILCIVDVEIRFLLIKEHLEWQQKIRELRQEMGKKEFWENLAENMEGTQFSACGLSFKKFTYDSSLKPLWDLEVAEPQPVEEPAPAQHKAFPDSISPAPVRPRRRRKWGFHPIGCLGKLVKLFFKLLLPAWLVLFGIHLWSPPAGDAPKPEPAKPKQAASVAAAKPAAGRQTAGQTQQGPQVGGKRFVVKQPLPIYRFDAEKKPVLMGRLPSGTVLQVVGKVNPKVARVSFALPGGRTVTGMARVADLKERTEVAE